MRKLVLGALFCILLSLVTAFAVECNDFDEQSDIEDTLDTAARVEYGLTPKTDECVSGKEGYHKDPSSWVREYYCATASAGESQTVMQRVYKDMDCTRYGYEKCEGGRCVGGKTSTNATKKQTSVAPSCGDKKLQPERGEQCDPPDGICYLDVNGKNQVGICTRPNPATKMGGCTCKLYSASGTATPEQPEENKEEKPTEGEKPPVEQPPAEEQKPEEKPQVEQPPAEREPLPTEKMEEPKGIGVTRAITNTVKRFFSWIGSWFD